MELLVSQALAPYIRNIHLDLKKFLFMRSLTAQLVLSNGLVIAA